jgi:S1-C subfamily serine protease
VAAGGPAAQVNLKARDIVTAVNGIPLEDEDFDAKIAAYESGQDSESVILGIRGA